MWQRGLLIVGERGTADLRPKELMRELGRGDFFTVLNESEAAQNWPDEAFDVILISPSCRTPAPLIAQCVSRRAPFLVLGCPRLDAESEALLAKYRTSGGHLLGPGSQGFFDWEQRLALCWSPSVRIPDSPPQERHVALIAQGGTAPFSLYAMAVEAGVRFRRVVSLGRGGGDDELLRQIEAVIADPKTTLLILCLEALSRGRDFLALTARAAARHLPVVLLRAGEAERFRARLDVRHPDAAWTDQTMWNSVARQYGVVPLDDAQQIVDLGKLASTVHTSRGNRVAVLAMSEGVAMMQGDQCEAAELNLVELSPGLRARIASCLPAWACSENPVNLSRHAFDDEEKLTAAIESIEESGECDMLLVATGALTPRQGEILAHALCAAHRRGKLPLACCCLSRWHPLENMVRRLNAEGVPLFSSPRRVAEAMSCLWRISRDVPAVSELRGPSRTSFLDGCPRELSERDAMALADAYGLKTVPHRLCSSVAEVLEASRTIGFPMVLKVVSPSFASKQQARAVALNLKTEEELRNAYGRILERVSRVHAGAEIQGVFAQKMITDGIECMIGIKRDRLFGPVVAVALGGAYYGLMKDIALRVAPVSVEEARGMIESLKGYPLISGAWFARENDVEALAEQIAALSQMACDEPDIESLDINPIFVRPKGKGAEIADAFAVRRAEA